MVSNSYYLYDMFHTCRIIAKKFLRISDQENEDIDINLLPMISRHNT